MTKRRGDESPEVRAAYDVLIADMHATADAIPARVEAARRRASCADATVPAAPTPDPPKRAGRNDLCPCGSGQKHKTCCLSIADAAKARAPVRGDGYLFQYKGSAVWWGKYYIPGNPKPQRFSTHEYDEKKAQKVLRQRTGAARNGDATTEDVRRRRYEDCERAMSENYRANGRRSLPDLPRTFEPLRAAFAGMRALAITTERMRAYSMQRLDDGAAPATVNKELGALRRMLTLGIGRKHRADVPMLHVENTRTGFVEIADFDALVAALPTHLQAPTRFAYLSAWRRAEVLGLTWARVTFDADGGGTVRLDGAQSKNGSGRVLPFVAGSPLALLLAEQRDRRRLDCPHVFHRNGKPLRYFYAAWRKACAAIGQPDLLFHDLRRSAVRNMVRAGVSQHVAMRRSGHKSDSMFRRYDIVSETDLREADEKVAAYLRAENGQSGRKVVAIDEKREAATC